MDISSEMRSEHTFIKWGQNSSFLLLICFGSLIYIITCEFYLNDASSLKIMATDSYNSLTAYFRRFADDLSETDSGMDHSYELGTCLSNASLLNQQAGLRPSLDLDTFNCTHLMTLSPNNDGRLGNQMFQAASLIGIAHWHGYTPIFHKTFNLHGVFRLTNNYSFTVKNLHHVSQDNTGNYCEKFYHLDHAKNWSLVGYLQSWKYFHNVEEKIRRTFTFKHTYISDATKYLGSIRKNGVKNVCVHVRRGDFLRFYKEGFTVAPRSYIARAMEVFYRRFAKVQFIFVSDDIKWCNRNFMNQNDTYFSPFKDPAQDLALLASCDHVIITSGSYGWWGALLAGGMTVYYLGYPEPGSWLATQFNTTEYYPERWIGMY